MSRAAFELADEGLADHLALGLGLADPRQLGEEPVGGPDMHEVDVEVVAEGGLDLGALVVAHQAVVDEHARQLVADGPVDQRRGDGGVHAAGQAAQHRPVADLVTNAADEVVDDVGGRPVGRDAGAVQEEGRQQVLAQRGVRHLRVVLHAEHRPLASSMAAHGAAAVDAMTAKPSGARETASRCDIHTDCDGGESPSSTTRPVDGEVGVAVLGHVRMGHGATQQLHHELLAVADAQRRARPAQGSRDP